MEIKCPKCGQLYDVQADYAGREVNCSSCGANFTVCVDTPAAVAAVPAAAPATPKKTNTARPPAPEKLIIPAPLDYYVLTIMGLLLLAGSILAIVYFRVREISLGLDGIFIFGGCALLGLLLCGFATLIKSASAIKDLLYYQIDHAVKK